MLQIFQDSGTAPHDAGPYACPEWSPKNGNSDTTGKVQTAVIKPSLRSLSIMMLGQSNLVNIAPLSGYVPPSGVENFNVYNGKNYEGTFPSLGPELGGGDVPGAPGEGPDLRVAAKLVAAGLQERVIVTNGAIGATSIAAWIPGGVLGDKPRFMLRRMQQAGIPPDVIVIVQGESDAYAGTSTEVYASRMRTLVAELRRNGSVAPVIVCQVSYYPGVSLSAREAIRAGQLAAADPAYGIFLGPDMDALLGPTFRQVDGLHLNSNGCDALATQIANQISGML